MAWTQAQLDALDQAIAEGALTVRYQDKQVQYRSLDEMMRIRSLMASELGVKARSPRRTYASFSKGMNGSTAQCGCGGEE